MFRISRTEFEEAGKKAATPLVLDADVAEGTEFKPGMAVKIAGLTGAAQLNGLLASVLRYVTESKRYEVALLSNRDIKAVQAKNLVALSLLDEVTAWKEYISRAEAKGSETFLAVKRLAELEVTVDVLTQTVIGKVVNDATKRFSDQVELAAIGRSLVARWRAKFQRAQAAERQEQGLTGSENNGTASPAASGSPTQQAGAAIVANMDRCLARVTVEGVSSQCKSKRKLPKFLCGIHQRVLDEHGKLNHGWIDGVNPDQLNKLAPTPKAVTTDPKLWQSRALEMKPMSVPADALKLLEAMRSAPSDRLKLGALMSLEQSPRTCLPAFVAAGGLAVLERWLTQSADSRYACLTILGKLPVSTHELKQVHMVEAVESVEQLDKLQDNCQKATDLLEHWVSSGIIPKRKPKAAQTMAAFQSQAAEQVSAPVPTQPTSSAGTASPLTGAAAVTAAPSIPSMSKRRAEAAAAPVTHLSTTTPSIASNAKPPREAMPELKRPRVSEAQPLELPAHCPPELRNLDPRIVRVLLDKPVILDFLTKHPSVMQNITADSVGFLTRNLRNSKETLEDASLDDEEGSSGCQVTMSGIPFEATEQEIADVVIQFGLGQAKVSIPRESRRQRSSGTAFVLMSSREEAMAAVSRLNGAVLNNRKISVHLTDGGSPPSQEDAPVRSSRRGRRIKWKLDEELWDVALFDRTETVDEFKQKLEAKIAPAMGPVPAQAHARFEAAASAERADEKMHFSEAFQTPSD